MTWTSEWMKLTFVVWTDSVFFFLLKLQLRFRNDSIMSIVPEPPEKASLYRRQREKENDFPLRRYSYLNFTAGRYNPTSFHWI